MDSFTQNATDSIDLSSLDKNDLLNLLQLKEQQYRDQIEELTQRVNWFEEQFKLLRHQKFAKSSEQLAVQFQLFDEDETACQAEDVKETPRTETITYQRKKPQRSEKNLDTSLLPREQNIVDLPEPDKVCTCGQCLEKFGEDRREELVFRPASYSVIEHVRYKYRCRHCDMVKMPSPVELPLKKCKANAGVLAEAIMNKYAYQLPFYRQSKMLKAHQLTVPDNTLAGWVMRAAEALMPVADAFWNEVPKLRALQVDETPVKVLKPEKTGYMWVYHSYLSDRRFVIFDFAMSRSGQEVNERLKNFKGLLQSDGYSGYNHQRRRDDIVSLGCMDHARRKFVDVVKAAGGNRSGKAGDILIKIGKLYEIEREIRGLSPDERWKIRQKRAKPKLKSLREYIDKINAPPKSLLGKAVRYCQLQWNELRRYVDYGEAEISNAWVENQIRPFAVGRRNWLFIGNEESGKKAALLYTLIQSCELNNIDARKYLTYILSQVHRLRRREIDPAELLPHRIDRALLENSAA